MDGYVRLRRQERNAELRVVWPDGGQSCIMQWSLVPQNTPNLSILMTLLSPHPKVNSTIQKS